jgi:hypothetical protein
MLGTEEKPVQVKGGTTTVMDFVLNANSGVKK